MLGQMCALTSYHLPASNICCPSGRALFFSNSARVNGSQLFRFLAGRQAQLLQIMGPIDGMESAVAQYEALAFQQSGSRLVLPPATCLPSVLPAGRAAWRWC
jgi:hypothetical protein